MLLRNHKKRVLYSEDYISEAFNIKVLKLETHSSAHRKRHNILTNQI